MKPYYFGKPDASTLLVQMVDDHDLSLLDEEYALISVQTGRTDFLLAGIKTDDWNRDLSPWPAPPVFGTEGFGDGAEETLAFLKDFISSCKENGNLSVFLGGYSLAGLFALWASCRTGLFDGIAGVSPSVWFPGFTGFVRKETVQTGSVYLSLGDREEKTRNKTMAQVGNAIREIDSILQSKGVHCVLEWNPGNHFKDTAMRTAKGFSWLMRH